MNDISKEELNAILSDMGNFRISVHIMQRFRERGISLSDIIAVVRHGEIIEQYPDDYPYPSCLILGKTVDGRCIHVCCGIGEGKIWFITAYFPSDDKWESDLKTRRKVSE